MSEEFVPPISDASEEDIVVEVAPEVTPVDELVDFSEEVAPAAVIDEPVVEDMKKSPAPKKAAKAASSAAPESAPYVVGKGETDNVYLSRAIYKNIYQSKVLTVHHIQRRLKEWGFPAAYSDKDGFYGDKTRRSVEQFQEHLGITPVSGLMDAETFTRLFENDQNVTVVL